MELGILQKEWIKSLREHPERQTKDILGYREDDGSYKACCLGELLICYRKLQGVDLFDFNGTKDYLIDGVEDYGSLYESYEEFGLHTPNGAIYKLSVGNDPLDIRSQNSLAQANDNGFTWLQIADFIENNPEAVFTKSV